MIRNCTSIAAMESMQSELEDFDLDWLQMQEEELLQEKLQYSQDQIASSGSPKSKVREPRRKGWKQGSLCVKDTGKFVAHPDISLNWYTYSSSSDSESDVEPLGQASGTSMPIAEAREAHSPISYRCLCTSKVCENNAERADSLSSKTQCLNMDPTVLKEKIMESPMQGMICRKLDLLTHSPILGRKHAEALNSPVRQFKKKTKKLAIPRQFPLVTIEHFC